MARFHPWVAAYAMVMERENLTASFTDNLSKSFRRRHSVLSRARTKFTHPFYAEQFEPVELNQVISLIEFAEF